MAERRTVTAVVRESPAELTARRAKAAAGVPLSALLRQAMARKDDVSKDNATFGTGPYHTEESMLRHRYGRIAVLLALVPLAQCTGAEPAEPNEESLRDSFVERIETTDLVTDFMREDDELRFTGPDGGGDTTAWRVVVETLLVEPREFDEEMPYEGRVTSNWYADGELVEYLGNMTALPKVYQDRGLGQECWAYWMESEGHWDW